MSRMKYLLVVVVVTMLLAPLVMAQEEAPQWSYVQAGWIDFNPDEGLSDDGWFAGGSMKLFKNFHLLAEYDDVGNYTFWNAGGGWHGLLGEKADVFANIMWANIQVDDDDIDEDGYDLQAGVRWRLIKWLELLGQVNFVDYGSTGGDDTTVEIGALFMFKRLGIGANWETGDADTARAFVRFTFGARK
jgi:hypothetical protein